MKLRFAAQARWLVLVAVAVLIGVGALHDAHAHVHAGAGANGLHATCAICQSHGAVGALSSALSSLREPEPTSPLVPIDGEDAVEPSPLKFDACRAPPRFLAI